MEISLKRSCLMYYLGTNQVDDAKARHAANIMAEYLDNDEDGQPDNPAGGGSIENESWIFVGLEKRIGPQYF